MQNQKAEVGIAGFYEGGWYVQWKKTVSVSL